MTLTKAYIIILLSFQSLFLSAQNARFNGGIVAGLNFAELEGIGITDYFGPNIGLIGNARLTRHSQLGLELLYSQNGEYILPTYYPAIEYGKIRLNHIEIPVHIDIMMGIFEKEEFLDWHLNFGLAYARLVDYSVFGKDKNNYDNQIIYENKEAMLLQLGSSYFFTKNIGINFKASLPLRIDGLSWTLAARGIFLFNA